MLISIIQLRVLVCHGMGVTQIFWDRHWISLGCSLENNVSVVCQGAY